VEISPNISADYLAEFPVVDKVKLQAKLTALLASRGYNEIITNSLTKAAYTQQFASVAAGQDVEILNKLSEDLGVMRQTLLFSGLEVIAHNINRRQKDLKLFEFGTTYHKTESKYQEKGHLALFVTGNKTAETWQQKSQPADFYDLAGAVQHILRRMHVSRFESDDTDQDIFRYGLKYTVNKKAVVQLGLLKPAVTKYLEIRQPVFYADIDWDYLLKQYSAALTVAEISRFPEVRRDLSLVIDRNVRFRDIRQLAMNTERRLLKEVNVFDVYEGENIGAEKKSYSVSFILQDENQTLTDDVIDRTMNRLIAAYEKDLQAVIRK
jgi:phenylalanyl-tRNA synthetase beta chain